MLTRIRRALKQEGSLIILFGVLGLLFAPLVGILAWHVWHGEPANGLAHIAGLFLF